MIVDFFKLTQEEIGAAEWMIILDCEQAYLGDKIYYYQRRIRKSGMEIEHFFKYSNNGLILRYIKNEVVDIKIVKFHWDGEILK